MQHDIPRYALSVRQPFAWLIVAGGKNIENRRWPTRFRGRCAIHASTTPYPDYDELCEAIEADYDLVIPSEVALGAIIGEVTVTGCVSESRSPWFSGPFGFVLTKPILYPKSIPCRGNKGFFEVTL